MASILEVSGLRKSYGNFELNDISFTIQEDCITGFIGANGAGKSTTIYSLLNLVRREAGTITFRGKDISADERLFKDKIGVVFDSSSFYDELTIQEMTSLIAPSYSEWNQHAYQEYLDMFSLQKEHIIGMLSLKCMQIVLHLFQIGHSAQYHGIIYCSFWNFFRISAISFMIAGTSRLWGQCPVQAPHSTQSSGRFPSGMASAKVALHSSFTSFTSL